MPSSNQTTSKVDQIRAMAKQRGYSDQEIDAKLSGMGLIDTPSAGGVGGGYGMIADIPNKMGQFARGVGTGLAGMSDVARLGFLTPGLPSMRGMVDQALPRPPQTPGDSVAMAGGEALGASLPFGPGAGMGALAAGSGMAGEGAKQAGFGPMGQMAASAAVGMGLPVAKFMLSGAVRSALAGASSRRAAGEQAAALIQAGDENAAITLGQVAPGGMGSAIEGGLKNIPGSSSVIHRALDKQAKEMGDRVEKIAGSVGPAASKEVVGAAVQRGIERHFIPNFKAKSEELYQRVYGLVPETAPVTPTSVTRLMVKQNDVMGMARELSDDIANPKFASILQHIDQAAESSADGTIPFGVIKELRSRLGAMLSGDELVADINLRDVKRLYGALTDDMATAVQKHGGTPATNAWNRANTFTRVGHERIDKILQPIVSKRLPEQAFTALMSGTKEGATALRSTLRSLDPAGAGLVRSNVLRNLGKMPDETFNPELFLRKLNELAPTSRAALFDGVEEQGDNLAALAAMAAARKAQGKVMFNPSGTAQNTSFFAMLNGLTQLGVSGAAALAGSQVGGGPGAALGAMAGPALTAIGANQLASRVFTAPKVVNWMVRQTKIPFGAMRQELAVLASQAQHWGPEDKEVALELAKTLTGMDWRSILHGAAAADATSVRR